MRLSSDIQQQTGFVRIEGGFTFDTHPAFKACTRALVENPGLTAIVLDMERVTHMDASSLGALLLLREASLPSKRVRILRPSGKVLDLLKVIQFDKLFPIER